VAADPGFAGIFKHDPLPREEAAVQAAGSRVRRAPPPRSAHGAEADVVGYVAGEGELSDQAGPALLAKVCPVPRAAAATTGRGARTLRPP
jgi:hypothetical protein